MSFRFLPACLALILTFSATVGSAQMQAVPVVTEAWINAGTAQRSMIQSIGVRFNRNVANSVTSESLQVRHVATGALVDLSTATLVYDPRNNSANWMIDRDLGALLADGNYLAWIKINTLLDPLQRDLMAVAGEPLDDFTFAFHQFVGDTDGDRDVDFRDASVLRETWQRNVNDDLYKSFLDLDLSNRVDESDRAEIETTYFTVLPPDPAIHLFLRNDTGEDPGDGLTSVYAAAFASIDTAEAESWQARLGEGAPLDITAQVTNGSGALDPATIDQLHGSPLTPGNYQLTVEALDAEGNVLTADTLPFEFLGETKFPPRFVSEPSPGVALGQVEDAAPLNLATWTVERWPGSQGPASWVIAPDGRSVEQTNNAAPSALISDQSFLNLRVTGTFQVDSRGDDDFMGFIFGYQNRGQFYVFDWKQSRQGSLGGTALAGMSIKRFDTPDDDLDEADFWWSNESRPKMTILAEPTGIGWKDFQEYQITLEFTPGRIVVEVFEEGTLLRRLEVADDTFTGGRFGFYNYSQDSVIYRGFTQESLNNVYFYDAEAIDPDGGDIIYSLTQAPAGASVDPDNGSVIWQPDSAGTFPFTLVATDPDGLSDTQDFHVEVTPVDEPPTVTIAKTAPSVLPGEEISFNVSGADDQQLFRVRFFIDGLEVPLDGTGGGAFGGVYTTSFSEPGLVELEAIAIDSAQQVTSQTSYVRVRDPDASSGEGPPATTVPPGGQVSGSPTDLRPRVSFDAPLTTTDDPTTFLGTVDGNGGTLASWLFEWAPAATVDFDNLAAPSVLWQQISAGTDPLTSQTLATITPGDYPDELIAFRLRAENQNGLGSLTSLVFNPQSVNTTSGPTTSTGSGNGIPALASFTAPLSLDDDPTLVRGTVDPDGGTLQSWVLDYAPRQAVNTDDLTDPSVGWTLAAQGTTPLTGGLLATLDPTGFDDQVYVFRLTARNTSGLGTIATLIYNPVAGNFSGPTGNTGNEVGNNPATARRPVTRITSPLTPTDDQTVVRGTVNANGGSLQNWILDYAPRTQVNPNDLTDPAVTWTLLATEGDEKSNEELAALTSPDFQAGSWILRLRAFNDNGLGSLTSIQYDTGDRSEPTVEITAPAGDSTISYLTEVTGSITSGGGVFDSWKLEIAPTDEVSLLNLNANANWVEIGSGTDAVADSVLGQIDPTALRNGSYVVRLRAFNTNGRGIADGIIVHVSGEAKLGNFRLEFEDLHLPLSGIPIRINRIYDTLNADRSGDFGYGWTLGIGDPNVRETVPDTGDSFFFATPFEIGTRVFVTTPDGRRVGFTFQVRNPRNRFLYVDYEPYFEPDPGVYESLSIAPVDYERVEVDASGTVYTPLLPFGYNPDNYRLTTRDGLVYDYSQRNGLQKITDRNGQTVTFSRNAITHSGGQQVTLTRDARGRITEIEAPDGTRITYRYDSLGDLIAVENGIGTTRLTYLQNPLHYLNTVATPEDAADGRFTRRVIYENGRFVRVVDRDGNALASQSFDPATFTGTSTDESGNVTTFTYDQRGNVLRSVSPEGAVTEYEYDDPANPDRETAVIDPNGLRTEYRYDANGNGIEEIQPTGIRVENDYDSGGRLTSVRIYDTNGDLMVSEGNTYDNQGRLTELRRTDDTTLQFTYDDQGRPTRFTDADGESVEFSYTGSFSIPTEQRFSSGQIINTVLDQGGRIINYSDNFGVEETRSYDAAGRLRTIEVTRGSSKSFTFDSAGNLTSSEDSLGRTIHNTYNVGGDILTRTYSSNPGPPTPEDPVVTFERDQAGRLIGLVDPAGNRTRLIRNRDGEVVERIDPLGNSTVIERDPGGRPTAIVDGRGLRREFTYNDDGKMVREVWLDASDAVVEVIENEYDSSLRVVTTSDSRFTYRFTHDITGLIESVTNSNTLGIPEITLSYTNNAKSLPMSVRDNRGTEVAYTYDGFREISSLEWTIGGAVVASSNYQRNQKGRVERVQRRSGGSISPVVSETLATYFPATGLLDTLQHLDASGTLIAPEGRTSYQYDSEGQITSRTIGNDTTNYFYDGQGQLRRAEDATTATMLEEYEYDPAGNRTRSHLRGEHVIGSANQLLSDDTFDYTYDPNGNLILKTERSTGNRIRYEWDHRNRNTRILVESADGDVLSSSLFVYDPFDRVVSRTVDDETTFTVWDDIHPWADYDASGNLLQQHLFGLTPDAALATWTLGGGVSWLLADLNQSTTFRLDSSGAVEERFFYDSFGNLLATSDPAFAFTGRPYQTSGLLNFRARLYDPQIGRFLSPDPLGFVGMDFNLYRFAENSPLGTRDPFGTTNVGSQLTAFSIIGTLARGLWVVGTRASAAAGAAFLAGAIGTLAVEVFDWGLSQLSCTEPRTLRMRETIETVINGAADNVRTSANGGLIGIVSAPLAAIYGFYTGPLYSAMQRAGTRSLQCLRSIQEGLNRMFDQLDEAGLMRDVDRQPGF